MFLKVTLKVIKNSDLSSNTGYSLSSELSNCSDGC